ncbi:MAG: hypothetical protein M1504_03330 [Candidatus Marsarchaeota archaeon]|nr:hypothetical protein [Candidatus Marsarchaeota archaeon]
MSAKAKAKGPIEGSAEVVVDHILLKSAHFERKNTRLIHELSNAQHPRYIAVGCSDSRVPIEDIFGAKLGESFTIRVAGTVLDIPEIGSIEYGVEHLGVGLILFIAHTNCGAVSAAQEVLKKESKDRRAKVPIKTPLDKTIKDIYENIKANPRNAHDLHSAIMDNANAEIRKLLSRSKVVRDAVKNGVLVVRLGVYETSTGALRFVK